MSTPKFRVARVEPAVLYELRRRVLRNNDPSQSVDEPRDFEPTALHFGGFLDDVLVVSASFYESPWPERPEMDGYQLRYMATDFDAQGKGFGAKVIDEAKTVLRERGVELLWANARDTALGFYRSTGWTLVEGSEHLSPWTQLPHTDIVLYLGGLERSLD